MTATTADRGVFAYRPHLDGLRTVAVYLVLVFHAGADRLTGGFIGVDLFFVLSGYLVTHVLISDLWTTGSVSLPRFYSRRVRRLLPAAGVTLVATAAVFALVASPAEASASLSSFRAAFLYYANWHFISASTDYFTTDLESNPVLHFWSLSIEEQFYVIWPLGLIGLTAMRRRLTGGDRIVRGLVLLLVIASAAWALYLADGNVNRAYYGTDTRAYQLLAGALLAMSPALVRSRRGSADRRVASVASALSLGAVLLLATSLVSTGPITRGILTTVAAVATLAFLERSGPGSPLRRMLSVEPLTYLGKISYGTYLWHWPVIVVLARVVDISPVATVVITAAVATGLASLSSQLLELPIRRSRTLQRVPRAVAIGGVTLSALIGLALVPRILDSGSGAGAPARVAAAARTEADVGGQAASTVDWKAASEDIARATGCVDTSAADCVVVDGDGPHVLLIGDSHGVMMRPALEEIARRRGYRLSVAAEYGCSWHLGLEKKNVTADDSARCRAVQQTWYEDLIPTLKPDLVVVIQRAVDDPDFPFDLATKGDESQEEAVRRTADATLDLLHSLGQRTVIIESIPVTGLDDDPLECLSVATVVEECRYVSRSGPTPIERYYEERDADDDLLSVVNIDGAVCPYLPICDPVVDGIVVKWDNTHLTTTYARAASEQIESLLEGAGALP